MSLAPKLTALGLALAVAVSASAQSPDWSQAQQVSVELSNFKFTPATLTLKHGTPYRLHLSNTSSGGHNFAAKEFFAASTVMPADAAKLKGGAIDLKAGESADIHVAPLQAGTYKLHCTHFMHSSFGMTGTIVVQ